MASGPERKFAAWRELCFCLALFSASCAPCRPLILESIPPGAEILLPAPSPTRETAEESWRSLGRAPLKISSCGVLEGVLARWDSEELFAPGPLPGSGVIFDFQRGEVFPRPAARAAPCQKFGGSGKLMR